MASPLLANWSAQKDAEVDELKKLRRRVTQEQARGCGENGKAYSEGLRRDVVAYLRSARAKGTSPNQLGPALGSSLPTAYRWSSKGKSAGKANAFRRVIMVSRQATGLDRPETTATTNQIVVTGPGGLQAVGLGIAEFADSILETVKLCGVDPRAYLQLVVEAAQWRNLRPDA